MKTRKLMVMSLLATMMAGTLVGCGKNDNTDTNNNNNTVSSGKGQVYYLNFKPEQADQWKEIAAEYEKETGVKVKVETAASGTYEQTLKSEIAKKDAPTLFQINGPVGLQAWKDYCLDLSKTELYSWLKDPNMAVKAENGGVYGIPYVVEGYGIIYNQEIMDKYFTLSGAKVASMDEIKNFGTLKSVVEDMTAKKEQLGIEGVFASTSFSTGEDWRWQTHLMNVPVSMEFKDANLSDKDAIEFTYAENFKNVLDLYLQNSITQPSMVGSKTVEDSMSEFALGKVAMVQNGNWAWGQVSSVSGNVVKEENIKFLPIYTGMEGEENQGLCTGTENFFSINKEASEADQKASIDFVEWVFGSEKGKQLVSEKLGFISPFHTFTEQDNPSDPLAKEVIRYMDIKELNSIPWNFTSFPSQTFKDNLGSSLLEYATGNKEWKNVVEDAKKDWADEKAMIAE